MPKCFLAQYEETAPVHVAIALAFNLQAVVNLPVRLIHLDPLTSMLTSRVSYDSPSHHTIESPADNLVSISPRDHQALPLSLGR
jgi:hypothetical protein